MRSKLNCSITVGALLDTNGITVNECKTSKDFISVVQYLEETL